MLSRELEVASALARQAGEILLEIYASDFAVDFKGKSDPVTEADRRVNAFLVDRLRAEFPQDGIVAEESADHSDAQHKARCWFVDPLDGTKEFVAKNGEFSCMIGLSIDGASRLGVVYQPQKDKLYRGVVGGGAALEVGGEAGELSVSAVADPAALKLVVSRSHRSADIDRIVAGLGIREERPSGSVGLKVGHIAERTADLYVHVSDRACKWDACGPEAILRAAGGRFTDLFGEPFDYTEPTIQNARGILACNAAAFDAVLPVVSEAAREAGFSAAGDGA